MDVSLGKLRQLVTVARCGSFSRAAEELHISQPALSRSIAAIEHRYGFQIFNRIGHGVEPTTAGAQVLAQAQPLLQSLRVFDSNMGLLASGMSGRLKMGVPPLLASQLLADLARCFFSPDGKIELRVSIRSAPVLLEDLRNDEVEFFLFADSQVETGSDVETSAVGAIRPICAVRAGHPLSGQARLTAADLREFPWASSVEPPAMGDFLNPARFLCDNYHVLREAVLHTDLICICSGVFAAQDIAAGRLLELDVEDFLPTESTIYMAMLKGRMLSPLAKAALKELSALLQPGRKLRG
jgi:DNA-binding transcriptional LysR family regulator